jgi:hypothetical protein
MAKSSRYFRVDEDVLLEFIYHDQSNPDEYEIEVDDNGSEIKFLTVDLGVDSPSQVKHLISELGSDVVNFDVTSTGASISIENFASRTLMLETGKTYKFNLSDLDNPSLFTINGNAGTYSLNASAIATFRPTITGTISYEYEGLNGGKIVIANKSNPIFSKPDEDTGNDINQTIGRFHAVRHVDDPIKYALLGYDSNGIYDEPFNYINNYPDWSGTNETGLAISMFDLTDAVNFVKYDYIRLHLRSGFSFSARNYEGFLFEVKTSRDNEVKNFLTQLVYLNQSNYEWSNPKPFIMGETLFTKFVEVKIPTVVSQNSQFDDQFYGDGNDGTSNLDPNSNYEVSFKLIDRLENIAGFDYFYVAEENTFTVSREDEFSDFSVVVEEAADGDYFKIYGERSGSIDALEAYVLNRINTSSDDIVIMYEVEMYEQIGTSFVKTYDMTFTQVEDFNQPITYRPVVLNGNVAVSFSIDVTMRIVNETDNTSIVKTASLTYDVAAKYAKEMRKLNISSTNKLTEVFNTLPNLSANRSVRGLIQNALPASTRYVPTFVENNNIVTGAVSVNVGSSSNADELPSEITDLENPEFNKSGEVSIYVPPFTAYYKFKIAKQENDDLIDVSLIGADNIVLTFGDGQNKRIFNNQANRDIDPSKGEVLFRIDEANASAIRGMANRQFYITSKSGSDNTVIAYGNFTIE